MGCRWQSNPFDWALGSQVCLQPAKHRFQRSGLLGQHEVLQLGSVSNLQRREVAWVA